jgi:glycylpeptide N-tetradecanoyltransferase
MNSRGSQEPETNIITDFFSFYSLPTQVIQSTEHDLLEAAYLFYYATSVAFEANSEWLDLLKLRLLNLIGDALVIADQVGHYHFACSFN